MAFEVTPGVWALERTRGCNVYLVRTTDGTFVIIDAAFRISANAIIKEVRAIVGSAAVTHLLLTHSHLDHVGAAAEVARAFGAQVVAGRGDCDLEAGVWRLRPDRVELGGLVPRWFRRPSMRLTRARIQVDIAVDTLIEVAPGIDAIPTPGHSAGSLCFLAREVGAIFVGDLVISHRHGLARSLTRANGDQAAYRASLAMIAAEAPGAGFAGHGYPVLKCFAEELRAMNSLPRVGGIRPAGRRARLMLAFARFLLRRGTPRR